MIVAELIRLEDSPDGVFGVLKINKEVFCYTLEPPDKLNKSNVSCIPEQQYLCKWVTTPKHGNTFEVTGVPGRSAILFHSGNVVDHTQGCILLGSEIGKLRSRRAVLNSGRTFDTFMNRIKDDRFHLTIIKVY